MVSRLLIFFNGGGTTDLRAIDHQWRDEQGRTEPRWEDLHSTKWPTGPNEPFDIKQVFLEKGKSEISEFDITVSSPSQLYHWLRTNDATQLSMLSIFSSASDIDSDTLPDELFKSEHYTRTSEWQRLFELLATDGVAPNLKHVKRFWDCYYGRRGLGKSVDFIRAMAKLRPKEQVTIGGYYGMHWRTYLQKEMCVPVIEQERGSDLGGFQSDTRGLIP